MCQILAPGLDGTVRARLPAEHPATRARLGLHQSPVGPRGAVIPAEYSPGGYLAVSRRLDGDRYRSTGRVVRGIRTGDAAATGIAPTDRVEVEPGLTGLGESTTARRTGDRRTGPITNGEGSMAIGRGRVEHRGHLLARRGPGGALGHPRETLPQHVAQRRRLDAPDSAPRWVPLGCRSVSTAPQRVPTDRSLFARARMATTTAIAMRTTKPTRSGSCPSASSAVTTTSSLAPKAGSGGVPR